MLSAPTGAGKAILLMMIANQALKANQSVLLLVDRITLINQLSETATKCGLTHNIIQGKHETQNNCTFTIASIQTLFRKGRNIPHFDLILIDEAHTLYTGITDYLKIYSGKVIGATATPYTIGLGNIYDTLISCTTAAELTNNGTLVPLLPYTFRKIDMKGAKLIGGEWAANEVHKRSAHILGDVVATYKKCVYGLRSICFCATIAHCEDVATQFKEAGIPVGVFSANTTEKERKKLLNDFDNKRILILISVSALSKGFDRPYVQCILDLRPLRRSLAEYVQMIGRGLRSGENKQECFLLDFTGNIDRFLPEYEDIFYNGVQFLDKGVWLNRVRNDKSLQNAQECPNCDNLYMHKTCTKCGYTVTPLARAITTDKADVNLVPVKISEKYSEFIAPPPQIDLPVHPNKKGVWATIQAYFR